MRSTAHSSKERRRPLFWRPFSAVTEPAHCLLVPLSGILAPRRREQRKNGEKTSQNGRDMAYEKECGLPFYNRGVCTTYDPLPSLCRAPNEIFAVFCSRAVDL